ncbi:MAG: hypothetical protein R6U52_08300 [Kosmotogaceae bacterium]
MNYADAGLETFLHLVNQGLKHPEIVAEPDALRLTLEKSEQRSVRIQINNVARGYLFGAAELENSVDGLSLSKSILGVSNNLSGKAGRQNQDNFQTDLSGRNSTGTESALNLEIDATRMVPGKTYHTSIVITSNASDSKVSIPVTISIYRKSMTSSTELWLVTLPLAIITAFIFYFNLTDQLFSDSFLAGIGPYVVFGGGILGPIIYNAFWSNSAKGKDNHLGNYLLSLLAYVGFAIFAYIFMHLIIMLLVIVAIGVALSIMGSSK